MRVSKVNYLKIAQLFRLVNCYGLPKFHGSLKHLVSGILCSSKTSRNLRRAEQVKPPKVGLCGFFAPRDLRLPQWKKMIKAYETPQKPSYIDGILIVFYGSYMMVFNMIHKNTVYCYHMCIHQSQRFGSGFRGGRWRLSNLAGGDPKCGSRPPAGAEGWDSRGQNDHIYYNIRIQ